MHFLPGRKILTAAESKDGQLHSFRLRKLATGEEIRKLTLPQSRTWVFSPDGKTLASELAGRIWLWDVAKDQELFPNPLACAASLDFTADGKLVTHHGDETRLWDPRTGQERGRQPLPGTPVSRHGISFFLVKGKTEQLRLCALDTGHELVHLQPS